MFKVVFDSLNYFQIIYFFMTMYDHASCLVCSCCCKIMLAKSHIDYAGSVEDESGIKSITGSHNVLQPGSGISHVSTKYYHTQY